MTKECFEKIRDDVILPYAQELLDIDAKLGYNCLKLNNSAVDKIFYNYERKRQVIRKYFMTSEAQPMDRHKIGSVMIYAVLKSQILIINRVKHRLPNELLMANEYLAIYLAFAIVESYRYNDFKKAKYPKEDERWRLEIPDTFHDDSPDTYIDNLCKALYYIKDPDNLDIFAYSNILYHLEVYTNKVNNYTPHKK